MNNNNNNVKQLAHHLEQEINWVEQLNALLVDEKSVLTNSQFIELEELANKKQDLSDKLEASARQRLELIQNSGINPEGNHSLQEFLKHSKGEEVQHVKNLNNQLAECLALCRELNSVNGQVISNNLHTRQQIVNVLSGKTADAVNIYNATGNVMTNNDNNHHQEA